MNSISYAFIGLFLVGGIIAVGVVNIPGLSVAPVTFTCVSQAQAQYWIQSYPPAEMSLDHTCNPYAGPQYSGYYTPSSSGGGGTTTTSTTTAYCGGIPYNPATQSCNGGTSTSSTISLATSTSITTVTSTITGATSNTTTTITVPATTTYSNKASSFSFSGSQWAGVGLSALSLVGLFVVERKPSSPL